MTKEELQNMTDEQLKELGLQRTETPPEEPKAEPAEPETPPEEPQELKEAKEAKEALEKQVDDLKKQVEKLEADNKELKKMKLVNKNEDSGTSKSVTVTKEEFAIMDQTDRHNLRKLDPEQYEKLIKEVQK